MLKRLCMVTAASLLSSCSLPKLHSNLPAGAPPSQVEARFAHLPPPGTYRIDSSGSELRLLVYRGGALASLGHNHVILNRSVTGSIDVAATVEASSFSLRAPIAAFIVDDGQARAEEGEEFPGDISDEAKTGTYNNMTGAALLNSMQYPVIEVRSIHVEQAQGTPTATLMVSVAGHETTLSVPFVLKAEPYGLSASASFDLRQSALGLTPFSLMLGALAVRDEMQVKLKIAAQM